MPSIVFPRKYKNIQRIRQIANVLIKHGLGYLVGRLNLFPLISLGKRVHLWRKQGEEEISPKSLAVRMRLVLEELGPSFVKLGQMISARPDLVPDEFCDELKKLQDSVPPFSFEEVRRMVEGEFDASLEELYKYFDPAPQAAASIAQVHLAELRDGQEVVVKVQRPGIGPMIERDIELLFYFARLLDSQVPEVRLYNPVGIAEEFARSIRREQDFSLEANNAQRLRDNFKDDPTVYVPCIYWELTSSKVITMEKVEGIPVDEVDRLKATGHDVKQIANYGCEAFLKQIFEHGFFHADPHPGNILIAADNQVILLDYGIMGHLDDEHMTHIANVLFALTDRDYDRLVHEYLMLGFATAETNVADFKRDLIDFFEPYYGKTLKNIPIGTVFTQAMRLMGKHHIQAPLDLTLLAKTFVFVESIGRQLDPDFDLLHIARPYASSLLQKRMHPKRIAALISKNLSEFGDLAKVMPRQTQLLLRKLLSGELEIGYIHNGLEPLIRERRYSNNILAITLIVTALIIASALFFQITPPPMFFGFPLGLISLGAAAFLGLLVIFFIFKQD